jgi:hypothetical protein
MNYFPQLSIESRVWVYQSNRPFTKEEKSNIEVNLNNFVAGWAAHGSQLVAKAEIVNDYFIVLAVDENTAMASGCSIDSSVKFIKEIGQQLNIDFFNRLKVVIEKNGETKMISFSDLTQYQDWNIYNTLVNNLKLLNSSFLIPVVESELFKMLV